MSASQLAGLMASSPAAVRLSDDTQVVFAFDPDGALWLRPQDGVGGDLLPWERVDDTAMAGDPAAVAAPDRTARLFAVDAAGTPHTATYRDGTFSGWTSIGGTGLTGRPAVVTMPGNLLRLFMRSASGTVVTQTQDSSGAFPGPSQPVRDVVTTGSPAAILDPALGRLAVVARGADNEVHYVYETAAGSGQWGRWSPVSGFSDPTATDPTVAPYRGSAGESWIIVFRNLDDLTRVYERGQVSPGGAQVRQSGRAGGGVSLTGHSLPAPPR